jgi:hypothetical protein
MKIRLITPRNEMILSGILLLGIILVIASVFTPWWTIELSPEAEMLENASMTTDYNLFSNVAATQSIGNITTTSSVSIANMTGDQAFADQTGYTFNVTFWIAMLGLILALIVFVLITIVPAKTRTRFGRLTYYVGIIAAILLFVSPVYLATNLKLSTASRVSPVPVPSEWIEPIPANVTTFWGAEQIPKTGAYPAWARGQMFWVWGGSTGWYLTFASSFLIGACALVMRSVYVAKKRAESQTFT